MGFHPVPTGRGGIFGRLKPRVLPGAIFVFSLTGEGKARGPVVGFCGFPPMTQSTRHGWGTRYFHFLPNGRMKSTRAGGWVLWFPTHDAKYASWVGHPAGIGISSRPYGTGMVLGMVTPGFTRGYFRLLPDGRMKGTRVDDWVLWFPTHDAKYASWMGHPAPGVKDGAPGYSDFSLTGEGKTRGPVVGFCGFPPLTQSARQGWGTRPISRSEAGTTS